MTNKLITITLTKTVPAFNFDQPNAAINKLIVDLAASGWELDFKELTLDKPKVGKICLGEE